MVYENRISAVLANSTLILREQINYELAFPQEITSGGVRLVDSSDLVNATLDTCLLETLRERYRSLDNSTAIIVAPDIRMEGSILEDELVALLVTRMQEYAARHYHYIVTLVGRVDAEELVALISVLEEKGLSYGIFGVSHGVMNGSMHGVLLYASGRPSVINSRVFWNYLGKTKAEYVREFIWAACYIEDEYEAFSDSFASFFDNAQLFQIYGRGVTGIPQGLLDFFNQFVTYRVEEYVYPVALVENATVKQAYLVVTIEYVPEDVVVYSNVTLNNARPGGKANVVRRYIVKVSVRTTLDNMVEDLKSSCRFAPKTPTKNDVSLMEIYETMSETLSGAQELLRGVAEEFKNDAPRFIVAKNDLISAIYGNFLSAREELRSMIFSWIDSNAPPIISDFLKGMASGIIDGSFPSIGAVISIIEDNFPEVAYLSQRLRNVAGGTVSNFRIVLLVLLYEFCKSVSEILSWIGVSLSGFIWSFGRMLGFPDGVIRVLDLLFTGDLSVSAKVYGDVAVFAEDELRRLVEDVSNGFVRALMDLANAIKGSLRRLYLAISGMVTDALEWVVLDSLFAGAILWSLTAKDGAVKYGKYWSMPGDDFDFIKALSALFFAGKSKQTQSDLKEVWGLFFDTVSNKYYLAPSTAPLPVFAKAWLSLMKLLGFDSSFVMVLTRHLLVELENGEIRWVNAKDTDLEYAIVYPGKKYRVKRVYAQAWTLVSARLGDDGSFKGTSMVYVAFARNVPREIREMVLNDFRGKSVAEADIRDGAKLFLLSPDAIRDDDFYDTHAKYTVRQLMGYDATSKVEMRSIFSDCDVEAFGMIADILRSVYSDKDVMRLGIISSAGEYVKNGKHLYILPDFYWSGLSSFIKSGLYLQLKFEDPELLDILTKYVGRPEIRVTRSGGAEYLVVFSIESNKRIKWREMLTRTKPPRGKKRVFKHMYLAKYMLLGFIEKVVSMGVDKDAKVIIGDETFSVNDVLKMAMSIFGKSWDQLSDKEKWLVESLVGRDNVELFLRSEGVIGLQEVDYTKINEIDLNLMRVPSVDGFVECRDTFGTMLSKAWFASGLPERASFYVNLYHLGKDANINVIKIINTLHASKELSWYIAAKSFESLACQLDTYIEVAEREGNAKIIKELKNLKSKVVEAYEKLFKLKKLLSEEMQDGLVKGSVGVFLRYGLLVGLIVASYVVAQRFIVSFPVFFAHIAGERWLQLALGALLTVFVIVGFNINVAWLKSVISTVKKGVKGLRNAIKMIIANLRRLGDKYDNVENAAVFLGAIITGMGFAFREILGVEFYTQDEVRMLIGNVLDQVYPGAGALWNQVMGLEIPFIRTTVFDIILGFALGGPVEVVGDAVFSLVMNVVFKVLEDVVIQMLVSVLFE